ncbi:NADH-quinone oxidoreductase subunit M [Geobacter pelophilus]|uniref:NADH-quinone oxidoreductase subunit M n=1 Tax=Geoanaerobacter pelophilus TaxID=60036 RepID=A0AAW4L1A6_9BACT|nr:NADH-quinone oxidoreductase subunit M [Geoanaerobacter pelophilus]MBT0664698.1 NADH-quinone oxidoreductase subunit M [Geoanaerobacter pelophilus]
MNGYPLLTILIFLPLATGLCLLPVWRCSDKLRQIAMGGALLELLLACLCWPVAQWPQAGAPAGFFLYQDLPWIAEFGIRYTLGMDGISLLLVMLTAFITMVAMLTSRHSITDRPGLHYLLILAMESGIMGVFLSLDLFLFYLFWELMLIPMFFLIGIWGHGRRIYSAIKFFLFTLVGSLLMLLAIIAIYLMHASQTGVHTFNLFSLAGTVVPHAAGLWLYSALLLAFAIKFPIFPLHTWLPDAHTDAPTAGSVILAGLLLKTGAYGLVRFGYPLFPDAAKTLTPLLLTLAVTGILYASWVAFAQRDMKRLVAYSSVGHMGFVALGIAAWTPVALSGAILQMVNHGVTTSALFAMIGMLDERTHSREISDYGGVWGKAPVLAFFFVLFAMASAGLPGLNNFVGEFLILTGSFKISHLAVILGFLGVILPLVYTVRLIQELLFQEERKPLTIPDLSVMECSMLAVMAAIDIYLGLHPAPLLDMLHTPVSILAGGAG